MQDWFDQQLYPNTKRSSGGNKKNAALGNNEMQEIICDELRKSEMNEYWH